MEDMSTLAKYFNSKWRDSLRTMLYWNEKLKEACPRLEAEIRENAAACQELLTSASQAATLSLMNQSETAAKILRSLNDDQAGDFTDFLRCFKGDQAGDFTDLWRDFSDGDFREVLREWNDDQSGDFEHIELD